MAFFKGIVAVVVWVGLLALFVVELRSAVVVRHVGALQLALEGWRDAMRWVALALAANTAVLLAVMSPWCYRSLVNALNGEQ